MDEGERGRTRAAMRTTVSSLQCHPLAASAVPSNMCELIVSTAFGADDELVVTYECVVGVAEIRLPPPTLAGPADELWRHTCCELFVGVIDNPDYREFNFSPSGQWAIYDFSAYRMPGVTATKEYPLHQFSTTPSGWRLIARIPSGLLPQPQTAILEFGLSVVLEAANGALSYWALAHAREKPDFHDRAGFILRGSEIPHG
jgi:hypothetical protein